MKTCSLIITALILSISVFSQKSVSPVHVNQQYNKTDTNRTFSIFQTDLDFTREKLLKYFGQPKRENTGNIEWQNVKIESIGSGLSIILTDGIFESDATKAKFKPFSDKTDKNQKLKELKQNQFRNITIQVVDVNNNNPINTKIKEQLMKQLLEKIIQ